MPNMIHLSPVLDSQLRGARNMIKKFRDAGKKELAIEWAIRALQITNQGCIEALERGYLHENEVLMYMDQSGEMNNPANKGKERTLELHLLVDTSLYNDVIALLKKHLNDGVQ